MKEAILYYANWCPHCVNFKPTWNKLKEDLSTQVTFKEYEDGNNKAQIAAANIQAYPTIKINGKEYLGDRSYNALKSFLSGQSGGSRNNFYEKYLKYKHKYINSGSN